MNLKIILGLFAIFLSSGQAFATAEKTAPAEAPVVSNPYLPQIEQKTEELGAKLNKQAQEHLYYVREGFGVTRVISIVRSDVDAAVKACGKANPDMKADIEAEFTAWKSKVDPVVKEKEKAIDAAIAEQTYLKPKEIRDYLKLIEQAGQHANKGLDKQIVTTPEKCKDLMESMDDTQSVVSKLLSDMKFLPWPPEGADAAETESTAPN
ncbi:MAG: hypothetical protein ACXW4B_00195 [Micavibrio sp.]